MIIYFILWFVLTSKFDLEGFIIGLGIVIAVSAFNEKNILPVKPILFFYKSYIFFIYSMILIKEIFIAGIQVARIVISIKPDISPCVVKYNMKIKNKFYRLIFCNSITLTPGTLTVEVEEDVLSIHCLTEKNANDLDNNLFEKLILKLEKKEEVIRNG